MVTFSSSNKKTKIYCHHDDDSDDDDLHAEDIMTIERVNNYCLAEIFMYITVYERPKMALVCKRWKEALDESWYNVKILKLTHWAFDEHSRFLETATNGPYTFLVSLLYKCGHYLTELDLSAYPDCQIVPFINLCCPNLVKLVIRLKNIHLHTIDNAFSNLSKLKVLKIIFDGSICKFFKYQVPITLIESLRNVANTLTDLNMSNWPERLSLVSFPDEITNVISRMRNLRKFELSCIECPKSLCDYINNSETIFGMCDHTHYFKGKVGLEQPFEHVEELNILSWKITDDAVYNIANTMKQLHTLRVSGIRLTDTGIITCTKMNNLKHLRLNGSNNSTDSSIQLLKNMIYLSLPWSDKITDESAIKVLENSPDMTFFSVKNTNITHKFIEKAAEISRIRKKELKLSVSLELHQTEYKYLNIDNAKKTNNKMKTTLR